MYVYFIIFSLENAWTPCVTQLPPFNKRKCLIFKASNYPIFILIIYFSSSILLHILLHILIHILIKSLFLFVFCWEGAKVMRGIQKIISGASLSEVLFLSTYFGATLCIVNKVTWLKWEIKWDFVFPYHWKKECKKGSSTRFRFFWSSLSNQ